MKTNRLVVLFAVILTLGLVWTSQHKSFEPNLEKAVTQPPNLAPVQPSPAPDPQKPQAESKPGRLTVTAYTAKEGSQTVSSPSAIATQPPAAAPTQSDAAALQTLPPTEQQSLWAALRTARHAVSKLTDAEKAMPQNEGVKYFAFNPGQKLTARFLDGAVRIQSGRNDDWAGTLRFDAGSEEATAPSFTTTADNRVEYQHPGGVTEWYVNRGNGIEHGFTVASRPADAVQSGELRLTLSLEGLETRAKLDNASAVASAVQFINPETGRAVLSYDHLQVWDANQQALPARLETAGSQVAIVVADAGAKYPLTIDPLITSLETKLEPEVTGDGYPGAQFGWKVALSGNTALIDELSAGNVYFFVRSGTNWSLEKELLLPGGSVGAALDIDGDTALVRDNVFVREGNEWSLQAQLLNGTNSPSAVALDADTAVLAGYFSGGVAYAKVFVRTGTNWSHQADLPQGAPAGYMPYDSLAFSGDTVVFGWRYATNSVGFGKACVFIREGTIWTQQAELYPNDPTSNNEFGNGVAIDGDTILVGARGYGSILPLPNGAAYVFVRTGTNWSQQQKLISQLPNSFSYGYDVAVSGDTAMVGTYQEGYIQEVQNGGAAYVYVRNGASWTQQARFATDSAIPISGYGSTVALDGDTALIDVPYGETEAGLSAPGSARVFVRSGTTWTLQARLDAGDSAANNEFGTSVAICGDTLLVGAPKDSTASGVENGTAHIFTRTGSVWSAQAKLESFQFEGWFGWSVALSEDTALIGAPIESYQKGAAYVFVRSGSVWTQQAHFIPNGAGTEQALFGQSVALSGNTALVGAPTEYIPGSVYAEGAVHVFVRTGSTWSQQTKWMGAVNDDDYYTLGFSLALSGDTAVLGSGYNAATDSEFVRVYVRTGNTWNQQADLVPDGNPANEYFGGPIAIQGDRVLVGAPNHFNTATSNRFGAYVFRRTGTNWSQEALLEIAGLQLPYIDFSSLALAGGTAVVGLPTWTNGAAVILQKHGSVWQQEAILTQPNPDAGDLYFGFAVAMSGNTLLVGASLDDSLDPVSDEWRMDHGAAYVYRVPYDLPALVESVDYAGNQAVVKCTAEPGFSYDLERSTNLQNWTTVLTTNTPVNGRFNYTDSSPPQPTATYRLKRNNN